MTSAVFPRFCIPLTVKQLVLSQHSFPLRIRTQYTSCLSYSKNHYSPKILPWSYSYSTQNIAPVTEHDEFIKSQLQSCNSVQDVLKKLDVRSDGLTGLSAAFTLQRIWQLKLGVNAESHIESRFLNELYSVINENISTLDNEILISLVGEYFQPQCTESMGKEIEKRLENSDFSVSELSLLSNALVSFHTELDYLVKHIWFHVCHRTNDMNEQNLSTLFICLPKKENFKTVKRNILRVLVKKFKETWWLLSGKDLALIATALKLHDIRYMAIYDLISKWLFININSMDFKDLTQIISAYLTLQIPSIVCLKALDKYVFAFSHNIDLDLLAQIMEYYCMNRYFSENALNAAAKNFIKHGHSYNALHLYSILRPFGYFNYRSPLLDDVFKIAEDNIHREFNNFQPLHIIQLLCSFVYIDRVPVNFASKILAPSFWIRCKDSLSSTDLANLEVCMSTLEKALRKVRAVRYATRNENANKKLPSARSGKNESVYYRFIYNLMMVLENDPIVVDYSVVMQRHSYISFGCVLFYNENNELLSLQDCPWDFEMKKIRAHKKWYFNSDTEDINVPMTISDSEEEKSRTQLIRDWLFDHKIRKLVFLLHPQDHYCQNTESLLGKYAMEKKLLSLGRSDIDIIEIKYDEIYHLRQKLKGLVPLKLKRGQYHDIAMRFRFFLMESVNRKQ